MREGPPSLWPDNHKWSSDWKDVTCGECLLGKNEVHTFMISPDGRSITCLRCHMTSFNPTDVERHYCSYCDVFHDDLWPPARRAWMHSLLATVNQVYDEDTFSVTDRQGQSHCIYVSNHDVNVGDIGILRYNDRDWSWKRLEKRETGVVLISRK